MNDRMRKRLRPFLSGTSGLTLVEILMTVMVYSVVLAAAYSVLTSGILSWQVNNVKVELQQELRKAMDWMMLDLRQAGVTSIDDVPVSNTWSTVITFSVANGVSGGVTTWTTDKISITSGEQEIPCSNGSMGQPPVTSRRILRCSRSGVR